MSICTICTFILMMLYSAVSFADGYAMLNVSYDPTRELYQELNNHFALTNPHSKIHQSHAGSSKQARAVSEGLPADIVTLASDFDVDMLVQKGLISDDWRSLFPASSSPYRSVIVFLVRKGNPKAINNWDDLVRSDVSVITSNPKTSGGARWNYLAAWGWAMQNYGQDQGQAQEFIRKLYKNVPILDVASRSASITFTKRHIGDVLITWENEAYLALKAAKHQEFEIITPPLTLEVKLPVVMVEKNLKKHRNKQLVTDYVNFLYSTAAQQIFAKHHYRPVDQQVMQNMQGSFQTTGTLVTQEELGTTADLQKTHFDDGGIFDQIYGS